MWNKETNRPDDWETLYLDYWDSLSGQFPPEISRLVYEVGADAAIPEAKAEGRRELIEFIVTTFSKELTLNQMMATTTWQELLQEEPWRDSDGRTVLGAGD